MFGGGTGTVKNIICEVRNGRAKSEDGEHAPELNTNTKCKYVICSSATSSNNWGKSVEVLTYKLTV